MRPPLKISEAQLQDAVVELAHALGWHCAHFRAARTNRGYRTPVAYDGAGFPDLVLVRTRVIFAEIKSDVGHMSLRQVWWNGWLLDANAEAVVIMPEDWRSGGVEKMLRHKAVRAEITPGQVSVSSAGDCEPGNPHFRPNGGNLEVPTVTTEQVGG